MKKSLLFLGTVFFLLFMSCTSSSEKEFVNTFRESPDLLSEKPFQFDNEELGKTENLDCYQSILVTHDMQDGFMYGLFNAETGKFKTRFGRIGQGEDEIMIGTWGKLWKDSYYVFNGFTENIYRYYDFDKSEVKVERISYDIPDSYFSQVAPVTSNSFLGMGVYHGKHHYVVFDSESHVTDSIGDVVGSDNADMTTGQKLLLNQGRLVRCADKPVFASTLNYSSNIDFLEVQEGKIHVLCSYSADDLILNPVLQGDAFSAHPTEESITGFLNLTGTDEYVFALYSDQPVNESKYESQTVLVFDWSGRKVAKLQLGSGAKSIAAYGSTLYALGTGEDGEMAIRSYQLNL